MSWRPSKRPHVANTRVEDQTEQAPTAGGRYISETGGNNAPPTYQDASGAPVENQSPLGYSVGPVTITLLNITMMIGAGIYSTREYISNHVNCQLLIWQSIVYPVWYGLSWRQSHLLDAWLSGMFGPTMIGKQHWLICLYSAVSHVWGCIS